nr:AsmA family protein [Ancylobacter oerskovii]
MLTLAGAVILAIAAAFAAPYVVDWTQWRASFEAQAARAIGAPVVIRGPIEARLLPTPSVVLRDVSVGVDAGGTGLTVRELAASLTLGELMRGRIAVQNLTLDEPSGRLVLDATGRVAQPTGIGTPADLGIAAFTINRGRLELVDRASGRMLRLDDIAATGALTSLAGPLKLDGEVTAAGARQKLKLGLAAFAPDGSSRLRLSLQQLDSPFLIDADGMLSLAGGRPAFAGKASVSTTPAAQAGLPGAGASATRAGWSLSGTVNATPAGLDAKDLTLALGASERPVELAGSGRLTTMPASQGRPGAARLELSLAARQVDLNAATGGAPPLAALNEVARAVAPLAGITAAGTLELAADSVLLAGAAMREVKAGLDWSGGGWAVRTLEAKLPGGARARLAGKVAGAFPGPAPAPGGEPALFTGTVAASAEDLPAFLAWAVPQADGLAAGLPAGAAKLDAGIALGADKVELSAMTLATGGLTLTGSGSYAFAADGRRGRVDAALAGRGVDLDPLIVPARRLMAAGGEALDIGLTFSGRTVRLAGVEAAGIDLALATGVQGIDIERLALANFGGIDLKGAGRVAAVGNPDGELRATLTGGRADGLAALARLAGFEPAQEMLATLGPDLAPVNVEATLASAGGRMDLSVAGRLGAYVGKGTLGFGGDRAATGSVGLDIADGSVFLGRLGVPGVRPKLGPARLELTAAPDIDATFAFAGARLAAEGKVARAEDGRLSPDLAVRLEEADLARLLPDLAAGGVASLPARLGARLTRDGDGYRLAGLTGTLAGTPLSGGLVYRPGAPEPVEADLSLPEWRLTTALALVAGRSAGEGRWPTTGFAPAPLAKVAGRVRLDIARLALPGGLVLERARLRARLGNGRATVEDIAGALAGGELAGRLDLARSGATVRADGSLTLKGASSAPLLAAAGVARPAARGSVDLSLDFTGAGTSPRGLVASLAGQGSLALDGVEVAATSPAALQYVMLATERGLPPEPRRVNELFEEGLARGTLRLPRVETTLGLVAGVARSGVARLAIGDQRFALSGGFDLASFGIEALLEIEETKASTAVAGASAGGTAALPAAAIRWTGPLTGPERRTDVTALVAAINMRALERETRRLEAEYGRTPLTNAGHATDAPERGAPERAAPSISLPPIPSPPGAQPPAAPAPQPQSNPLPALQAPPQRQVQRDVSREPPREARPEVPSGAPPASPPPFQMQPGSPAPPLPPPVDIPPDALLNPIMQPPLAP